MSDLKQDTSNKEVPVFHEGCHYMGSLGHVCNKCGQLVKEGNPQKISDWIWAEQPNKILGKAVTQDKLTLDTVGAQFCSDWLRDQIRALFHGREALLVENAQLREAIRNAQFHVEQEMPSGAWDILNRATTEIKGTSTMDNFQRRNQIDLMTPAERAIHHAIVEVEKLPANTLLTDAVVLLLQAKDRVSAHVDTQPAENGV